MGQPRYQLLRLLGRGGVAEVFEGLALGDSGFRRRVAIKRLVAQDPELRDAFIDEARILGAIHHQNVVSILGVGAVEGTLFQVLELVDGVDLGGLRERLDKDGLELPVELCLFIAAEIAKALDVVHRATGHEGLPLGIVHRDVTPRNILLSWGGAVKLADFGVCFAHQRATHTRVGFTKGTPAYMSPEQAAGGPLDGRADLYGLGCVLRFLAGPGASSAPPLASLIGRLTAHDRAVRPANADDAARLLLALALREGAQDLSRALRTFLEPLMPSQTSKPPEAPKLASLFDFEPSGSSEGDVVEYSKVARAPSPEATDTRPWPTQSAVAPQPPAAAWLKLGLFAGLLAVSALTTILYLRASQSAIEIAPTLALRPVAITATVAANSPQPEPEPTASPTEPAPFKPRAPRRPSARPSPEPDGRLVGAEVERLQLCLKDNALRIGDLTPSLVARWDAAVASKSVDATRALWPELELDIEHRRTSANVLRRRIARSGERLRLTAGKAPTAKVEELERTYFRLRRRLAEPLAEPEAKKLWSETEEWEREVSALQ